MRLAPEDYKQLREQVLRRDGWRCQRCGSLSHLEIHHIIFRSRSGSDIEQNLITLCARCHGAVHATPEILEVPLGEAQGRMGRGARGPVNHQTSHL